MSTTLCTYKNSLLLLWHSVFRNLVFVSSTLHLTKIIFISRHVRIRTAHMMRRSRVWMVGLMVVMTSFDVGAAGVVMMKVGVAGGCLVVWRTWGEVIVHVTGVVIILRRIIRCARIARRAPAKCIVLRDILIVSRSHRRARSGSWRWSATARGCTRCVVASTGVIGHGWVAGFTCVQVGLHVYGRTRFHVPRLSNRIPLWRLGRNSTSAGSSRLATGGIDAWIGLRLLTTLGSSVLKPDLEQTQYLNITWNKRTVRILVLISICITLLKFITCDKLI